MLLNNPYAFLLLLLCINTGVLAQSPKRSAPFDSKPLTEQGDLSSLMVAGIARYLDRALTASVEQRAAYWRRDFTDSSAYERSIEQNRNRLAHIIGVVDTLAPAVEMEYIATTSARAKVTENEYFATYAVRWRLFGNVYGEGLLLQPKSEVKARVIAVPDADQVPEMLVGLMPGLPPSQQYARLLAENGCQVVIPTILSRSDLGSGSARMHRYTNQPQREWVYRQAYTFGRHIIGYEVQKIMAAVNWFENENRKTGVPIGIIGWGEGGLLGFYSAALDRRIDAALISGYFSKRENIWQEPIYRNLFGLLQEFGDAEIASLVVPRSLTVEYAEFPEVKGPPPARPGSSRLGASAAPGTIETPSFSRVAAEVNRAKQLAGKFNNSIQFIHDNGKTTKQLNENSLLVFLKQLQPEIQSLNSQNRSSLKEDILVNTEDRQLRQLKELEHHMQHLIQSSHHVRDEFFWNKTTLTTPEAWRESMQTYKDYFWNNVIGKIPKSEIPLNPHSRQIFDKTTWAGYELTLDVAPAIYAWGYLLLPKDLTPGEKRPVIVVQHGGSGLPKNVLDKNGVYKGLAVQLVERGFIVFAPHFPWRAGDSYRNLQRRANPLGLSIFSVILSQHERILEWLTAQSFVDPERIGLYGLSWGGKVAVRVPALLERYSLTIASGDFNEWIWKNATTDWPNSYMFVPEYEMFDFNLGSTFNYGEMAALIAPRAFMVERGHDDGVGIDEWVAFEYAKVNRLYNKLKIPDRTRIEYFDGGHEINAEGALAFIQQQFNWPEKNE